MPADESLPIDGYEGAVEIGRGGFGIVYRALQIDVRRTVAIKVLTGPFDERVALRFNRERDAMGLLSTHPNCVTVHASGFLPDGRPYIVMEYLELGSLADRLAMGPVPWEAAIDIGIKLAGALGTAHRVGVLHRDIKPENVLMSAYGDPKLADFGVARLANAPETRSGSITASLFHAAPEIFLGERPTEKSEVYSLASTVFSLIAGTPPFARDTDESIVPLFARVATEPVPDLRARKVPAAVCEVLEAALEKDRSQRIGSAAEFGTRLQTAQRSCGLSVTPMVGVGDSGGGRTDRARVAPEPSSPRGGETVGTPPVDHGSLGAASSPGASLSPRRPRVAMAGLVLAAVIAGGVWAVSRGDNPDRGAVSVAPTNVSCPGPFTKAADGSGRLQPAWKLDVRGAARAKPVAVGNIAVIATDRGEVYGARISDGQVAFHTSVDGPVLGDSGSEGSSVYLATTNGGIYRVRPGESGSAARVRRLAQLGLPLGGVAVIGDRLYVGVTSARGGVLVIDRETGRLRTRIDTAGAVFGAPVADTQRTFVYFAAAGGTAYQLSIATNRLRTFAGGGRIEAGGTLAGGRLVVATTGGLVRALDPSDGRPVWQRHLPLGNSKVRPGVFAAPATVNGQVYVGAINCNLYALDQLGRPLWQAKLTGTIRGAPVVLGERVYVTSSAGVVDGLKAGEPAADFGDERTFAGSRPAVSLAVAGETLLVGTASGSVIALKQPAE